MLKLITDAAVEPVSLADAKAQLRVTNTQDDTLITGLITAARQHAERYMGRPLINQNWQLWMDRFPVLPKKDTKWWDGVRDGYVADLFYDNAYIDLNLPLVNTINNLTYFDLSNNSFVYASTNYFLDQATEPSRLVINIGSVLPTGVRNRNAMYVDFIAGYGAAAANVPPVIIQAIKMLISHLYDNRGDQFEEIPIPRSYFSLLEGYQVKRLA